MSGYCSIGSDTKPMVPSSTKKMDITVESTGRFMKLVNVIVFLLMLSYQTVFRLRAGDVGRSLSPPRGLFAFHGVHEA